MAAPSRAPIGEINKAVLNGNPLNTKGTFQMQTAQTFAPLDAETRTHVDTACAAFHLTRKPQTMRAWACLENGPLRPIRISGRLAWAVADIKRLLNGGK
jgi:hypothetical protein